MSKFNVGDKVVCTRAYGGNREAVGKTGTVIKNSVPGYVGVQFEDYICGHECGMGGKKGHCWNFETEGYLEKVESNHSIHITCTDNKTTHAVKKVDGNIVARSKAVCCPGDEFNANIGAQLAFNRLVYGTDYHPSEVALKPEPKQEPVKLYCVKSREAAFTSGNVYEVINNEIRYDDGVFGYFPSDFQQAKKEFPRLADCLVPLVSRPAQVGEWVYINVNAIGTAGRHIGKVVKITSINDCGNPFFNPDNDPTYDASLTLKEYLVLDGYKPEPEYLNMRVVCVDTGRCTNVTVGRVYAVEAGKIKHDGGLVGPIETTPYESLKDLNAKAAAHSGAKFIEFKGE